MSSPAPQARLMDSDLEIRGSRRSCQGLGHGDTWGSYVASVLHTNCCRRTKQQRNARFIIATRVACGHRGLRKRNAMTVSQNPALAATELHKNIWAGCIGIADVAALFNVPRFALGFKSTPRGAIADSRAPDMLFPCRLRCWSTLFAAL